MKRGAAVTPESRKQRISRQRVFLTSRLIAVLASFTWLVAAAPVLAQGMLGNPADMGHESGIGLVSGWHRDAEVIEVQFDAYDPIEAAYGTSREDTIAACGDADNGFGLLWNWNILGDGQHTVRVFADDVDLRTELVSLETGRDLEITWQDPKQNFVITHVEQSDVSMGAIIAALGGTWSGYWNAPTGSGSVSMTFGDDGMGRMVVNDILLSETGCAAQGAGIGSGININDPLIDAVMDDGSIVEFEFLVTESLTAIGGSFWFASGPCADTDGIYSLFRN